MVLTVARDRGQLFHGTGLGSILLMVVACVLPWLLPLRVGVAWLVLQPRARWCRCSCAAWTSRSLEAVLQAVLYVGLLRLRLRHQPGRHASRRRRARSSAGSMPSCAPPARCWPRASRVNERTRISRELHDLLGHHLTALSLNLEVAGHLSEGRAQEHVQQAHTLAKLLLTDVREAVSQLREERGDRPGAALRPLAENVPALRHPHGHPSSR